MRLLVTGSSGLVGSELCQKIDAQKFLVEKLDRLKGKKKEYSPEWILNVAELSAAPFSIIHLAGENIAAKRWSKKQKNAIYNSRILGTRNLVNQILSYDLKPKAFICASAIGFYGDRGIERLDENSEPGMNFVSNVCKDWEFETRPLVDQGIRVVNLRFGVILSKNGGALKKMLLPFKLGFGGVIGKGQQMFSWISIDDAIKIILHILKNKQLNGPINVTAPNPVSNKVFTEKLAKQLDRFAFIPMPAAICRLAFGELADELLLSSQNVMPDKLLDSGYTYDFPDITLALKHVLS